MIEGERIGVGRRKCSGYAEHTFFLVNQYRGQLSEKRKMGNCGAGSEAGKRYEPTKQTEELRLKKRPKNMVIDKGFERLGTCFENQRFLAQRWFSRRSKRWCEK